MMHSKDDTIGEEMVRRAKEREALYKSSWQRFKQARKQKAMRKAGKAKVKP